MNSERFLKLRKKAYRSAYSRHKVVQGLAFQIKELRIERGLTQAKLASLLGLKGQSAVARMEDPSYGKMSIQTLLKIANVLDITLLVKFLPYSKFLIETEDVRPESLRAPSFDDECAKGDIEYVEMLLEDMAFSRAKTIESNVPNFFAPFLTLESPALTLDVRPMFVSSEINDVSFVMENCYDE